ncbi:MAG: hydrogenase maturation protease [Geminicoccaceae bacterium]
MRILVAGVGNVLRGDDGFGVHAANRLKADPRLSPNVAIIETGISGINLVQELMRGYNGFLLLDAFDRGREPGALFLLEPELPDVGAFDLGEQRDFFADVHYAAPARALTLAREIGALPELVRIIGCQSADAEAFGEAMDKRVRQAIPEAVDLALQILREIEAP